MELGPPHPLRMDNVFKGAINQLKGNPYLRSTKQGNHIIFTYHGNEMNSFWTEFEKISICRNHKHLYTDVKCLTKDGSLMYMFTIYDRGVYKIDFTLFSKQTGNSRIIDRGELI